MEFTEKFPKELQDYLETKIRPYHNRVSYISGAIDLYEKLFEDQKPLAKIIKMHPHDPHRA